jgi:hypothetical protein
MRLNLPVEILATPRFLRLAIIGGVLLASAYLAPRASERYILLLLAASVAVVFFRWPPLGLAFLIVSSLVVPFAIGTGTQTSINAAFLVLALLLGLWLLNLVRQRELRLPSSPVHLPLLSFVLIAIIAFIAGQLPLNAFASTAPERAQIGGLAIFVLSAGAFLLVAHQIKDLRWLERLTWLFLALAGLFMTGRLLPSLGAITNHVFQDGADASIFRTWVVALAFGQAAFNHQLRRRWRLALAGLVLATLYIGLFQSRSWASGWLPPIVALIATLCVGAPRVGLLTTLVTGSLVTLNMQIIISRLVMVGDQSYSLMTRLEAWRILAEIVRVSPVLGLGPANYYWYTALYPILGWYVKFNSHNNYVDLVAQIGLLGLACFLWFIWRLWWLGWRLRQHAPTKFSQAYVYGALGGLAGTLASMMLADTFLPFVYNIGFTGFRSSVLGWMFLGGLVALYYETRKRQEKGTLRELDPLITPLHVEKNDDKRT